MKRLILSALLCGTAAFAGVKLYQTSEGGEIGKREFAAVVYSKDEVSVSTKMSGYIKKMAVEEGDSVKRGALLFEVDATDASTAQVQANASFIAAKAAVADAAKDVERYGPLHEKGLVSDRDFEKMKLSLQIKKEQRDAAAAVVTQAKNLSGYTSVRSPADGVIVKKLGGAGQLVMPGQPVLLLNSLAQLRVKADMDEGDAQNFTVGESVAVFVPSLGKTIKAKTLSIVPTGAGHIFSVKFLPDHTSGLMPNMYAKVYCEKQKSGGSSAIAVPPSVLTKRGGLTGVFALTGRTAKFIPVVVRKTSADRVEVSGISAGIKLIEYPKADLVDGKTVE